MGVGEVAVEVNVVGVVAPCAADGVVAAVIGAVGIGEWPDEEVEALRPFSRLPSVLLFA